jgi:hypothetical protein
MDDTPLSSGLMTTPDNPAAVAAREEYGRIMSDPTHEKHAGYLRRDPSVEAYIDGLYKKAYQETSPPDAPSDPVPLREPEQDSTMTFEDRQAHGEIDTLLRRTFGDEYDTEMRDMRIGGGYLFGTQETQALFEKLSPLITDLGPRAEVFGIRFLADLGRLAKQRRIP